MTKQDKAHAILRKIDYLYLQKGWTFCQALKEITKGNLELTDGEIIENIKDIHPDNKKVKE